MKNLFDPAAAEHIKQRLAHLKPDSPRQWGSMNPAQAMAHCAAGLQLAAGELKPLALGNDDPIRRNAPTVKGLVIHDDRNLDKERQLLARSIDRFVAAGPAGCTTHPHSFFGRLTPQQWAILMYKHLDHHLRQFGA